MSDTERVLILGAAGRDFHNFNVAYRDDPRVTVVAFTAAQIPGIEGRRYPAALAGPRYPQGIPNARRLTVRSYGRATPVPPARMTDRRGGTIMPTYVMLTRLTLETGKSSAEIKALPWERFEIVLPAA